MSAAHQVSSAQQSDGTPDAGFSGPALVDSGLSSLLTIASLHGVPADAMQLRHRFGDAPFDSRTLVLAARSLGLSAKSVATRPERLLKAPLPAIGSDRDGRFFVVAKINSASDHSVRLLIQKAGEGPIVLSFSDFLAHWNGRLVFITSKASFAPDLGRFDFTWFIPIVVKYRKLLLEVLVISLILQVLGLATPLFFQVVMDKVLVNHAMKTLDVIGVGLLVTIFFDVTLTALRTYVFAHTSSKIDVELGAKLFHHLLSLPTSYFQVRRVGDSVARIRELESIRSFLTGNAMTLLLDVLFSFVFLSVMLWYSEALTMIVIASIPLYVALSLLFTPILRSRLNEKFNRGAENQSFLVESIAGIDTIRSMAVEPRWQARWERQLAGYVSASLATISVGLLASNGVTLISKLVTLAIMWLGSGMVVNGKLTVGELVAFNMLAGQISSPILRLAQLWNDFQQIGISMARLGDILNARPEVAGQKSRLPRVIGSIELDAVSFRYRPELPEVLRAISLRILPGEIIGVVGHSGSGKSTLTKLVQRLYTPDRGRVLIDGHDLSMIDATSLRHQIGVVLQENMLFNRSIRDNIALANPALSIEVIIEAATLAGAHEFIRELPEGYDTVIGEYGAGLSGGQRQRLAIARALISNPRILIFDEATSALDYESEKVVQDNMRRICAGRTVLIIAHRLSAVRDADRIVVMDRGEISEMGSHSELLGHAGGIYAHLYQLQLLGQEKATSASGSSQPAGMARSPMTGVAGQ